jgi:hypothetical protein
MAVADFERAVEPRARPRSRLRSGLAALGAFGLAALALGVLMLSKELLTVREFWFMVHLSFGILIVHAFAGGLGTLLSTKDTPLRELVRVTTTITMALIAWLTVVSGTWMVYPGYRAKPVQGQPLESYPKEDLLAQGELGFWHNFGMEWKEHIGWLTPFLATAVAFCVLRYGRQVMREPRIRRALTSLFVIAFAAAVVAAILGAAINAVAPNEFLNDSRIV